MPRFDLFLQFHSVHITMTISSIFLSSEKPKSINSRNEEKLRTCRNSQPGMASHTSNIFEHSHKAWYVVSGAEWQCSHTSSVRIFLFRKFHLTGIASRHARQRKFWTLFGTGRLQILFQISLCWCWLAYEVERIASLARNLEPDFTE